jgi:hypothetical protein
MDHDPQLAVELRVCRAYGIPHTAFLEWEKSDRDKAIWEHVRSLTACGGCGTRPEEWDPNRGGHPHAYRAVPEPCPGCQQLESLRATLSKRDPAETRGIHVKLIRNEEVRRARLDAA